MAIQIKAIERGEPGVKGGGKKKFYATPVHGKVLDLDGLTKAIEKTSTVNGADIRAVLYAMVEETVIGLSETRIIDLADLGRLRITVSSEGRNKVEEVSGKSVKKVSVIFTPGKKLKEMFQSVKISKD
jgi:predicted histone-like DNA-binding protein